jgi:hypothetical protein
MFAVEPGVVGNSVHRHGRDIDIRATYDDGSGEPKHGQVVLPTPLNGRVWLKPPLSVAKAAAPPWLYEQYARTTPPPLAPAMTAKAHTVFGEAELERLCWRIRNAPHGTRDTTRNASIFFIARYTAGGEMEESDAWREALDAAHNQQSYGEPVDHKQIDYQALRSWREGMKQPLSRDVELGLVDVGDAAAYEKWFREQGQS